MSDQPVAEADTYTTHEKNIHAVSGIRTHDPSNRSTPVSSSCERDISYLVYRLVRHPNRNTAVEHLTCSLCVVTFCVLVGC
jgi:hypothetical protein